MNRTDLQTLAQIRVDDARALLDAERFAAAYYLSGYAVECALKACVAKQIREHDFPDKRLIIDSYSHDLAKLLRLAGIGDLHASQTATNAEFARKWLIVKDWSEDARYDPTITDEAARDMYAAVTDDPDGLLTWLKKYW